MKEFEVTYKFSDVIDTIEAETEEEAQKIADERLLTDYNPQQDTTCYEIEVLEIEEDV